MSFKDYICQVPQSFYDNKVPLFTDKYNRWIIALPIDAKDNLENRVKYFLSHVANQAISWGGNARALRIIGTSDIWPDLSTAKSAINKIPIGDDVIYVGFEFYYSGTANSAPWPWSSRGFAIQCPEDILSGLIAVMNPVSGVEPPGILDDMKASFDEIIIDINDNFIEPLIKPVKDTAKYVVYGLGGLLVLAIIFKVVRK